jgi:hypothetical protein
MLWSIGVLARPVMRDCAVGARLPRQGVFVYSAPTTDHDVGNDFT